MNNEIDLTKVREELTSGKMINAVKELRHITGLGLKEARDYVTSMPEHLAYKLEGERQRAEDRANERDAAERELINERALTRDLKVALAAAPSNRDIMDRLDDIEQMLIDVLAELRNL